MTLTLYDAPRCPYCARVRIVLAEKRVLYDTVEIDLANRPAWIYEKNPLGKVPVLEEGGWALPESNVIMEFLEELYPAPVLLPSDPAERAHVRLLVHRFDHVLGNDYYAFRRSEPNELEERLDTLPLRVGADFTLAEVAYLPWVLRARDLLGLELPRHVAEWVDSVSARPSVAAELAVVARL